MTPATGVLSGFRGVLDVLLPPACVGCREPLRADSSGAPVCSRCRARLRPPSHPRCGRCDLPLGTGRAPDAPCPECRAWPEALSAARCAVALEPPADALVHGLKYEGWWTLAGFMADRLAPLGVAGVGGMGANDPPLVVPVPTTPVRIRSRGYNQAELLAKGFAERLGFPVWRGVERHGESATQVSLHPLERKANVSAAFVVREESGLVTRDVLLVDDVLTTGATAGAVAEVLVESGARTVTLVAFARALPQGL